MFHCTPRMRQASDTRKMTRALSLRDSQQRLEAIEEVKLVAAAGLIPKPPPVSSVVITADPRISWDRGRWHGGLVLLTGAWASVVYATTSCRRRGANFPPGFSLTARQKFTRRLHDSIGGSRARRASLDHACTLQSSWSRAQSRACMFEGNGNRCGGDDGARSKCYAGTHSCVQCINQRPSCSRSSIAKSHANCAITATGASHGCKVSQRWSVKYMGYARGL